jgi:Rha family phage regulatory protein
MKNELMTVDDFGVMEKHGIPVVSSRRVAEIFKKSHKNVLRDIEIGIEKLRDAGELNFELTNILKSDYRTSQNRRQPEFLLTKDGFVYLTMSYTGIKATQFKVAYINRFNQMEQFIRNLSVAKMEFPAFTNAVMLAHEEPKHYHFSNELDMINRIVLGVSSKQFKEMHGIPKDEPSIRPYLTDRQIKAIVDLQRADIGLLVSTPDFQERKEHLARFYGKLELKRLA